MRSLEYLVENNLEPVSDDYIEMSRELGFNESGIIYGIYKDKISGTIWGENTKEGFGFKLDFDKSKLTIEHFRFFIGKLLYIIESNKIKNDNANDI